MKYARTRIGAGRAARRPANLSVDAALLAEAKALGVNLSGLLEEALRMRECPGIYFVTEPSGRTAKVAGTGLAVWEVTRDALVLGGREEGIQAAFPTLSKAQIAAAIMYFRRYPEEIRREIEENASLTSDVVEREYPGLVRVAQLG